ncbi:PIN domain-containing protein [Candidatus Woesearchaeota archaeon]|nr:PIN domain-containing protein [Candidatus Woesearchaeota archaeon]
MTSFLDSNVIIYAFTRSANRQKCRDLLQREELISNTLVLLESYAKLGTITDQAHATKVIRHLLGLGNLKIAGMDNNLFFEAVKRNRKYKLKISDLVHYTTALLSNCDGIISYDKHFDSLELERKDHKRKILALVEAYPM